MGGKVLFNKNRTTHSRAWRVPGGREACKPLSAPWQQVFGFRGPTLAWERLFEIPEVILLRPAPFCVRDQGKRPHGKGSGHNERGQYTGRPGRSLAKLACYTIPIKTGPCLGGAGHLNSSRPLQAHSHRTAIGEKSAQHVPWQPAGQHGGGGGGHWLGAHDSVMVLQPPGSQLLIVPGGHLWKIQIVHSRTHLPSCKEHGPQVTDCGMIP
jgi:hypothetical protein